MRIVLATKNPHKIEEIRAILSGLPLELVPATSARAPDVVEDAPTIEGNALKKAYIVSAHADTWALADDTGLEVAALDGAPGVHSARYAGERATYAENCEKLLRALEGVPAERRQARFRCHVVLMRPSESPGATPRALYGYTGALEGSIATAPRGEQGFGYDPIFLVAGDRQGRTLAELSPDEKNRVSHRARALEKLARALKDLLKPAR